MGLGSREEWFATLVPTECARATTAAGGEGGGHNKGKHRNTSTLEEHDAACNTSSWIWRSAAMRT